MKLCFITVGRWSVDILEGNTRAAGGAEAQVAYLARAFAQQGNPVDLIYGNGDSPARVSMIAGVRCVNAFPAWKRPGSILRFWQALKESDADLVYVRLPLDFLWVAGLFVRKHPRTKFIYALGNDKHCNPWHTYPWKGWFHNSVYALGLRMANYVALQHEGQARLVKPFTNGQLVLIPNLVRSIHGEVRPYENTAIDAIWISHIRPQKKLSILLDIAGQLPELRFVVVGGFGRDPDRNELERRMQGMRNLRYEGPREFEDVIQLLKSSRVLVNTSSWEGFPNTMLDAWSVGVPVVSLQIDPGGVISREGLGLVSGTQTQMVGDIMKLVGDRQINCAMGTKGLAYVRRAHGIEAVSQAFEQVLPEIQIQKSAVHEEAA